ncbi:CPBP family intramembrane glutamic endopeptidase [Streptosporangium sp. NBC_01469]|uniref:CPBP family intramembrane glutamic endopeptidase n=1 Tax=Streptosporangium sp. NBC_01469 TaxID=2903898 RepID=UPI002E290B37|nr:CPBP family intramembrane glutamic endopeptidase [Streptosporangium sp. NBC_01469]
MGLIAFAAAVLIRIRALAAFAVRRAKPRHFMVAAVLGLVAYVLGTIVAVVYMLVSGDTQNVQTSYQAAAAAGWWSLVLALVAGAIITPLGEEGFFRGVLANPLFARYQAWIAVFAVAHGINPILPVAFVVGVLAALLFRWSGSIWPGVVLHGVNNATALLAPRSSPSPGREETRRRVRVGGAAREDCGAHSFRVTEPCACPCDAGRANRRAALTLLRCRVPERHADLRTARNRSCGAEVVSFADGRRDQSAERRREPSTPEYSPDPG